MQKLPFFTDRIYSAKSDCYFGKDAYAKVTGEDENFESVRGHVIDFKNYKLIPIYHPQYLLRNPESKKITLNDLNTIKSCL
jgi:DNA polymerase